MNGHDGFAGELGHTIIFPDGRYHPGTGSHGCLEMYCSASGLTKTAHEMLERKPDESTLLRQYLPDQIDSKIVYECAMKNDVLAKEVYQYTGNVLGMALANFAMFSSPQAIILFGGLTKAGDLLMLPTKKSFETNLLPLFRDKIQLIFSELFEVKHWLLYCSLYLKE